MSYSFNKYIRLRLICDHQHNKEDYLACNVDEERWIQEVVRVTQTQIHMQVYTLSNHKAGPWEGASQEKDEWAEVSSADAVVEQHTVTKKVLSTNLFTDRNLSHSCCTCHSERLSGVSVSGMCCTAWLDICDFAEAIHHTRHNMLSILYFKGSSVLFEREVEEKLGLDAWVPQVRVEDARVSKLRPQSEIYRQGAKQECYTH